MDKDEIAATLAQVERKAFLNFAAAPALSWFGVLGLAPLLFLFADYAFTTSIVEIVLIFAGSVSTFDAHGYWKDFREKRAVVLWSALRAQSPFSQGLSPSTADLSHNISKIYQQDPMGEFFPLPQALRLLDTHHRQQQRARLVNARLIELEAVQATLAGKIKQLHELGANSEDGQANLRQIESDTAALKTLKDQIEDSCRRLEMILISVQTAFKTRQLQREIVELGSRATSSTALDIAAPENELSDIERQIGREIETFLQLERETERHFA